MGCTARFSEPQPSSKPLFLFTADVFPILTSPHHLTPERFHDFLSLSTSPPLPYNHNLHHNQERPTTATEEPTREERGTSPSNGGRPTSDTPSAPSFAQVGTKRDVIGSGFLSKCPSLASFPVLCESGVYTPFVLCLFYRLFKENHLQCGPSSPPVVHEVCTVDRKYCMPMCIGREHCSALVAHW